MSHRNTRERLDDLALLGLANNITTGGKVNSPEYWMPSMRLAELCPGKTGDG